MKYIASFVFLLSLLPFMAVEARSDDLHPTIQERKIDNYEVRNAIPTLEPANLAIQESAVRPSDQNQVVKDIRNPRDEQMPRDRQAVLCEPKFGGDPSDPGCQKPTPQPTPVPPQGGPNNPPSPSVGGGDPGPTSVSSGTGGGVGGSSVVLGLSNTSSGMLPLNWIAILCLVKGLHLLKKSFEN